MALRIAAKYYGEPRRMNASWARRHGAQSGPPQLEGAHLNAIHSPAALDSCC